MKGHLFMYCMYCGMCSTVLPRTQFTLEAVLRGLFAPNGQDAVS